MDNATASARRPTLAKVAALAGVSPSTASIAFSGSGPVSDETREKVLAAARELRYGGPDPRAQSLRRGRSGVVGVVLDERLLHAFRDPIKIATLDGISDVLGPTGAGILLLPEQERGQVSLDSAPMDAVVLMGCAPAQLLSLPALERRGIPVVVVEGEAVSGMPLISLDNRVASATIARHLRELGHERVEIVALPLDVERTSGPIPDGWSSGTTRTTIDRILGTHDVFPGAIGRVAAASLVEEGQIAGRALLADRAAEERPTAIIAQSDLLAAGVILAAEELGIRVPEDLSVVGFDGVRVPGLSSDYDLTTMVQPSVEKGRAAGRAIVALLAGETVEDISFESSFHPGNTTAPPPARS